MAMGDPRLLHGQLEVVLVAVASIKGFEFTESTTFCGELCHVVMEPEHEAWSNSPHAKVKCVECHVGPGAAWYVKAKISGMRQLYAVLFHTYPETIETPIENLRPARRPPPPLPFGGPRVR